MPPIALTDALRNVCYGAGRLVAVEHALFDGDAHFIRAVRLVFESYAVVFRAVPEDDTIAAAAGDLLLEPGEVRATATTAAAWAACVGREVVWAWHLTNQQGYDDAVRLEFEPGRSGVELVVAASAIRLYAFTAVT